MKLRISILLLSFCSVISRDPASEQLINYYRGQNETAKILTGYGTPCEDVSSTLRVGKTGPILIQDQIFFDTYGRFDRERIPERVVHAKGAGAFGYFEVTHDITLYTKAIIFEKVGKRTKVAIRFSTVIGETGSADTLRDPRGFAIKFYTEHGIWDLVGNNTPIFFVRDPLKFPMFIHSQKRNPVTHMRDRDMFWDFVTLQPETAHQMMRLFSDRGTPDGFRHMNGYGSHTFKMVNKRNKPIYVKLHFLTDQGMKNLTAAEAEYLAAKDPDYAIRDLYNAIHVGNYPSWTLYIQLMTFKQAENFHWNPFDVTKIWPEDEYPLLPVGRLVLNKNPKNYFKEVEQIAFSPANMIPGIEPSPDIMLQGRMFSYADTQLYRLGTNYLSLPVNAPFTDNRVTNYQRDGSSCVQNQDGSPTYYPNSFGGPQAVPKSASSPFYTSGDVKRYNSNHEDNFSQCTMLWNSFAQDERERLVENIIDHVKDAAPFLQDHVADMFNNVAKEFGAKLKHGLYVARTKKSTTVASCKGHK